MNKKAFTLVEILGVIVILGIIGLIVTPIVQSVIDDSNTKACYAQVESIKRAARNYVSSNPFILDENDYVKKIYVKDLISKGYLEEDEIKNPKGGIFEGYSYVQVDYSTKKITYEYISDPKEKPCK